MRRIRLLEVPGDDFLFVLEGPLDESVDSDVIPMESIIPQKQIEELLDSETSEFELVTGELALGLRRHMLQEQIVFYEDRENLEEAIRRSKEFPEASRSREEIENDWQISLKQLRVILAKLTETSEEKK